MDGTLDADELKAGSAREAQGKRLRSFRFLGIQAAWTHRRRIPQEDGTSQDGDQQRNNLSYAIITGVMTCYDYNYIMFYLCPGLASDSRSRAVSPAQRARQVEDFDKH